MDEQRIYVVVAGTVQVPAATIVHFTPDNKRIVRPNFTKGSRTVIQVPGRQIAQACHVVSKLRYYQNPLSRLVNAENQEFQPVTTIILQCRDSAELGHNFFQLVKKKLNPVIFSDTNEAVYGPGEVPTALAVFASQKQLVGILDYLPLWGAQ